MSSIGGATENPVSGTAPKSVELVLDMSQANTAGTWKCKAEYVHTNGSPLSAEAEVVVETFLSHPSNDAVVSGTSVTLSCSVPIDVSKRPTSIKW